MDKQNIELIPINNFNLAMLPDEEEPRMPDIELGKRLEFKRPRSIRQIIKKYLESGDLIDTLEMRHASWRISGKRPNTVLYWLSEADSLFITSKSETPVANQLTREIIQVFIAVRKRLIPRSNADSINLEDWKCCIENLGSLIETVAMTVEALKKNDDRIKEALKASKEETIIAMMKMLKKSEANIKSSITRAKAQGVNINIKMPKNSKVN